MKKFILKLDLHDDKDKRKALKTVSTLSGIDAITMNMKDKTLTVIGSVDPINVVSKLRKFWPTDIVSVGPAKEPEKKQEPKKEEGKKEEGKKEDAKKEEGKKDEEKKGEAKKEDDGKKEEPKKKEEGKEEEKKSVPPQPRMIMPYRPYYPPMNAYYNNYQPLPYQHSYQPPYHLNYQPQHHSIEENPNACVIS